MDLMKWFQARLKEPSTYAGLASLFVLLHFSVSDDLMNVVSSIGTAISTILAFIIKEKSNA